MIRRAFTAVALGAFLWSAAPVVSPAQVLSIMPLGDSLTWGYDGGPDTPAYLDSLDTGGYRSPLYSLLTADHIGVTYVGVNNDNPSPVLTAAGQTAHNGFNGYTINEVDGNLAGSVSSADGVSNLGGYWLTGGGGTGRGPETANVILLQIGANDIGQGYDPLYNPSQPYNTAGESATQFAADETTRLENLINDIMYYEPNATLLVDGTTPIINPFLGAAGTEVQDYGSDVDTLISTTYQNKSVHYVDMYDAFLLSGTSEVNSALFAGDGVHLTTQGYDVMAQTWDTAILADVDLVPEPSTYGLFIGGALALFVWRRKRTV